MPDFAASLVDGLGEVSITLNATSSAFTITDSSNYTASTESGHLEADFSEYRQLTISTQSGATVILSSLSTDTDTLIPTPDSGNNVFTQDVFDGSGVYKFELITLPTWNNTATYDSTSGDYVYYNSKIYRAVDTADVGQAPDVNTADWLEVTEDQVPLKYRVTERVVEICDLTSCKEDYINKALCVMNNSICDDEALCASPDWMNANKLLMLEKAIELAVEYADWASAENAMRLSKKICNCNC